VKSLINRISPFSRFLLVVIVLFIITFSLFRLAFWIAFKTPADPVPISLLLHSLYLGLKFDLRLTLVMILPVMAFSWIRPIHLFHSRFGRSFWNGYLTIMAALIFLVYLADFAHFAYLHTRLNATAVYLLEDTAISLNMVWETYPILRVIFALIATTALYSYATFRLIRRYGELSPIAFSKRQKMVTISVTLFFVLMGLYGKLSYYPLRWSDAFYSTNSFASAITINPVHYLIDTFRAGNKKPYDEKIVREHYDEIASFLGVAASERKPFNYTRVVYPTKAIGTSPNIVLIQLESFSYQKTGLYGSSLNATPYFNELAKKGLFFNNYFAPHWGTARAVFTSVTGIPDVETHNTSTRNPVIICQHTIINAFTGYDKFYFLGGSASWGNIRGLLSNNIHDLVIYEEGSYPVAGGMAPPRVDVWGISDLALFEEANRVLKQKQDKPFFAIIQTAGNHRPYTIPKDNNRFQVLSPDSATLEKMGFESADEFNAFRFLDHSIGLFMEMARKETYFENTIFVFFGDHGTTAGRGDLTPRWEPDLNLTGFHVPFLIYAPKLISEGKVYSKLSGHPDILPTLAGLTKNQYQNTTMGRDLLDPNLDTRRAAFTITHGTVSEIGLLEDNYYFLMNDDGTHKRLNRRDSDSPREDILLQFPQQADKMEHLLRGIHETSKYMLYHNNDCK
jgi:phosphoglycerol transferase MdoB-like AlkP superfamily enzyme